MKQNNVYFNTKKNVLIDYFFKKEIVYKKFHLKPNKKKIEVMFEFSRKKYHVFSKILINKLNIYFFLISKDG